MFSKIVESVGQSFGRVRDWVKERHESNADESNGSFERERSNFTEMGSDDQQSNRNGLISDCFEASVEREEYISAEHYANNGIPTSCHGRSYWDEMQDSFNEHPDREFRCNSFTATAATKDVVFIRGPLLKPNTSRLNPTMDRRAPSDESVPIQRSITPDARYFGRPRPGQNPNLVVPVPLQQSDARGKGRSICSCGSISNSSSYERRTSNCSITKIKLAIRATEDDGQDCHPRKYSIFMEEIVVNSCEEDIIEKFDTNDGEINRDSNIKEPVDTKAIDDMDRDSRRRDDGILPEVNMNRTGPSRGPVAGIVKVSLQFFEKSKMLRIIVLRASKLKARRGYVYAKISAHYIATEKKMEVLKLAKAKAGNEVAFNEQLFLEDVEEEDIDGLVLSFRLYNKEGIFRSKKCLGEMIIPVFKYDLSMDTSIKGTLRENRVDQNDLEVFDDTGDLEITSEDRSIAASVAASLNLNTTQRSPRFKRMNSLPAKFVNGTRQRYY